MLRLFSRIKLNPLINLNAPINQASGASPMITAQQGRAFHQSVMSLQKKMYQGCFNFSSVWLSDSYLLIGYQCLS